MFWSLVIDTSNTLITLNPMIINLKFKISTTKKSSSQKQLFFNKKCRFTGYKGSFCNQKQGETPDYFQAECQPI